MRQLAKDSLAHVPRSMYGTPVTLDLERELGRTYVVNVDKSPVLRTSDRRLAFDSFRGLTGR